MSVAIPKKDRSPGGGRRLMGKIVRISGKVHKSYKIG